MAHSVVPCHRRPLKDRPEARSGHVSFAYGPCVYVWGGYQELQIARWNDERYLSPSALWAFNTFTREWTQHVCTGELPKPSSGSCAVIHGHHFYLFAGFTDTHTNSNSLYKLNLKTYVWQRADGLPHSDDYSDPDDTDEDEIQFQKKKSGPTPSLPPASMPSRRDKLCGWAYQNCLYFFGGFGPSIHGDAAYLKGDGVWVADNTAASQMLRGWNNQLLRFDLDSRRWSTVATSGPRPLPRAAMCCALLGDRVYIFGGRHETTRRADMICLNMKTMEWSSELVPPPDCERPSGRSWSSLTVVDRNLLFLYGGYDQASTPLHDGFLFDVRDNRWTQIPQQTMPDLGALPLVPSPSWMDTRPRPTTHKGLFWHTAVSLLCPPTAAANPGIYVFGGMLTPISQSANMTFHSSHLLHFAFQPKSLTALTLENLAQTIARVNRPPSPLPPPPQDEDASRSKSEDVEMALKVIESFVPRPLPAVLRSRVNALISISNLEKDASRRPSQLLGLLEGFLPRPTDGAGGNLGDNVEDSSDSDDDDDFMHPDPDVIVLSDSDSLDAEDDDEPADYGNH